MTKRKFSFCNLNCFPQVLARPGQGVDVKSLPAPVSPPPSRPDPSAFPHLSVQIPMVNGLPTSEPPSPRKNVPFYADKTVSAPRTPKLLESAGLQGFGKSLSTFQERLFKRIKNLRNKENMLLIKLLHLFQYLRAIGSTVYHLIEFYFSIMLHISV